MKQLQRSLYLFSFCLIFNSCSKDDAVEENNTPRLSIIESSIPQEPLSQEGGTFNLEIYSEYTGWKVLEGEVIEGSRFISSISPEMSGPGGGGGIIKETTITYSKNNNSDINKQYLIVESLSGNLQEKIVLTQNQQEVLLHGITLNTATTYQTISGFGGCNTVFRRNNYPSENDIQKAYGTGQGELGLSIFRVSIPPNDSRWPAIAEVAKFAQDRGAIVFASPWDAPDNMLDPNHSENRVLPSRYGDYVAHLNRFDDFMTSNGVNLHAISIQNEPDYGEWTRWTKDEIFDFTKNYANGINTNVITAESFNYNRTYYTDILNDPIATDNIDIVGGHIYGNGLGTIPLAEERNKEIWMTEYLLNEFSDDVSGDDWSVLTAQQKWDQSIVMLNSIHRAMESNWNAYIWWYLKRYYSFIGDGFEESQDGQVLKRGFAFSHFSKFIRPGYQRVEMTLNTDSNLKTTAYKSPTDTTIIVVVLNEQNTAVNNVILNLPESVSDGVYYTTSLEKTLQSTTIDFNQDLIFDLEPKSITTFVLN